MKHFFIITKENPKSELIYKKDLEDKLNDKQLTIFYESYITLSLLYNIIQNTNDNQKTIELINNKLKNKNYNDFNSINNILNTINNIQNNYNYIINIASLNCNNYRLLIYKKDNLFDFQNNMPIKNYDINELIYELKDIINYNTSNNIYTFDDVSPYYHIALNNIINKVQSISITIIGNSNTLKYYSHNQNLSLINTKTLKKNRSF